MHSFSFLKCLQDVILAARWLHFQNVSHNDIKEENVFIKLLEGQPRAFLGDVDFMSPFGYRRFSGDPAHLSYPVWDPCFQNTCVATPFNDRFSLLRVLLRYFKVEVDNNRFISFRDKIVSDINSSELKPSKEYYSFFSSGDYDRELKPVAKKAYNMFFSLILKSTSLIKELEKEPEFPVMISFKQIFDGMKKVEEVGSHSCEIEEIFDLTK